MLEDELMLDIFRNRVYRFCFVIVIDVVRYKIDWELTEGGEEDDKGERGRRKGFTDKPNHPILSLKVWIEIKEWTEGGVKGEGREETRGEDKRKIKRKWEKKNSRFNDKKISSSVRGEGKRAEWWKTSEGQSRRRFKWVKGKIWTTPTSCIDLFCSSYFL